MRYPCVSWTLAEQERFPEIHSVVFSVLLFQAEDLGNQRRTWRL